MTLSQDRCQYCGAIFDADAGRCPVCLLTFEDEMKETGYTTIQLSSEMIGRLAGFFERREARKVENERLVVEWLEEKKRRGITEGLQLEGYLEWKQRGRETSPLGAEE